MKVFYSLAQATGLAGCALALGNFDGVHLGHQALLRRAGELGKAAVLTFDPHPGKVLQPALGPQTITPLPRKLELLAGAGVEAAVVQPFTREYAKTSAEAFEGSVLDGLGAHHLVVGADFTYGARRSGDRHTLGAAALRRGAKLHVIAPVTVDGLVVSSTKIREYLLAGRVEAAARLLGRPFDLDGEVVRGKGRGRALGFPTANLKTQAELLPATGIYAVRARLGELWHPGAASVGFNPTFGEGELTAEVYLIDFRGDLYGQSLRVQFLERLRPERRFESVDALVSQMHRDVEQARAIAAREP